MEEKPRHTNPICSRCFDMHAVNQWLASFSAVPTSQDELSHCDSLGENIWHHGILWCQVTKNYRNCNSSARWGQLSGRYHNILSLWKFWLHSWEATTCLTSGFNSGSQMCGSSCRGLARKSAVPEGLMLVCVMPALHLRNTEHVPLPVEWLSFWIWMRKMVLF